MNPTLPWALGSLNIWASPSSSPPLADVSGPKRAWMRSIISRVVTIVACWNSATSAKGMTSMKRNCQGRSIVRAARSTTSSSLKPRITTALSLIGVRPASSDAAMPASTSRTSPQRVMRLNLAGSSESMLMFTRSRPAALSGRASLPSFSPLVVIAISRVFGSERISATMSIRLGRTVGSPPVRRNLSKPSIDAARRAVLISASVSNSAVGRKTICSGMQYTQRRLHLSVSETRK